MSVMSKERTELLESLGIIFPILDQYEYKSDDEEEQGNQHFPSHDEEEHDNRLVLSSSDDEDEEGQVNRHERNRHPYDDYLGIDPEYFHSRFGRHGGFDGYGYQIGYNGVIVEYGSRDNVTVPDNTVDSSP